jgi:hypothetical protein
MEIEMKPEKHLITIYPNTTGIVVSYRYSFSTSIDVHIACSYSAHRILVWDWGVSSCCIHRLICHFEAICERDIEDLLE